MFKRQKLYGMIPLTNSALLQCAKLAVYQAEHLRGQPLIHGPTRPIPKKGTTEERKDQNWQPYWTSFPTVSTCCKKACKMLL